MQAAEILDTFKKLGITAYVKGDKLVCEPGSKLPPDLKPEIREHRAELMALLLFQPTLQTEAPYIRLDQAQPGEIDLPFPLGNGGLDSKQVEMAERHNTRLGVVGPVERRLNVLFWLVQFYQESGDTEMASEVKAAYHSLRDASPDVVTLVRIGELSEEVLLDRLRN